jgi:excinuclease UvrABC nuclease subunit
MKNPITINQVASIEIADLRQFTWAERRQIPRTSGVYFIILNGQLVYIGQACRFRDRFDRHQIVKQLQSEPSLRLACLEIAQNDHADIFLAEQYFIAKYKPPMNKCAACSPRGIYGKAFNSQIGQAIAANYQHKLNS